MNEFPNGGEEKERRLHPDKKDSTTPSSTKIGKALAQRVRTSERGLFRPRFNRGNRRTG